jgi:transposase
MSHGNARLTLHGRRLLVKRVRVDRRPVAHVAKEMGISRQCAHRWVARFDAEGDAGLRDRSSRPRSSLNATPAELVALVLACRDTQRVGRDEVARRTGIPPRTVSRILARHGRPPLAWLDPTTGQLIRASRSTALRYEREAPGDLIHVDVKKLGRIPDGGGWRAHGRSEGVRGRGIGFDYVHAAVDDHSRIAYAEVLPDEKGATAAGFLLRAAGFFAEHGIPIREVITDNALAYRHSVAFRDAVGVLGAKQRFIKPHCPWQNGKVCED